MDRHSQPKCAGNGVSLTPRYKRRRESEQLHGCGESYLLPAKINGERSPMFRLEPGLNIDGCGAHWTATRE
jgi:hypothetical protein